MADRIERKRLAILRILQEAHRPLGSHRITEILNQRGIDISERTVRFHLLSLDSGGLTRGGGRRGRRITEKGISELAKARVFEKVGFLAAKIDQMAFSMRFDPHRCAGNVVVNLSTLRIDQALEAVPLMLRVFQAGYSMGRLLCLFGPGERVGEMFIPQGCLGVGTVCSITLNGVLLSAGIPVRSRFGGLLEMEGGQPSRWVAIINYDGTSLDPLEIFIKSGMTDYLGATGAGGNGIIGASFRELPAASRERVIELAGRLEEIGLGGFLRIGFPGSPLLEVPVDEGRIGAIVIGGLNPVAILEEKGFEVHSRALTGFVDYGSLFPHSELEERMNQLLRGGIAREKPKAVTS